MLQLSCTSKERGVVDVQALALRHHQCCMRPQHIRNTTCAFIRGSSSHAARDKASAIESSTGHCSVATARSEVATCCAVMLPANC